MNEREFPESLNNSRTDLIWYNSIQVDTLSSSKQRLEKKQGTSNTETLMHIIKANIGTGILAMPLAFKHGGLVLSSISLWIIAIVCVHCMHVLMNCSKYVTCNMKKEIEEMYTKTLGYDDVVELVLKEKFIKDSKWPGRFKFLTSLFLVIGQLGFCCVYLVFIPTNIKQVVDFYYPSVGLSLEILMIITLLPLILFCLIKDLKFLAPFSAVANLLMIVSLAVIIYGLFFDGPFKPIERLDLIAPINSWPIYFSSAIYAFEGISLVLPVYHEMKNKTDFSPWNGVLNTGMSLVGIMYFSIGFFGYIKYGNDSAPSITLNLQTSNIFYQIVKILFAVAIFITYNLQFYVAADIIWTHVLRKSKYVQSLSTKSGSFTNLSESQASDLNKSASKIYNLIHNIFRSSLVILTFLVAIKVPRIDLFISLVGAIASTMLALIIPAILDLVVFWKYTNKTFSKLLKNFLIIIFGVYIFISGTLASLTDIFNYLKNN